MDKHLELCKCDYCGEPINKYDNWLEVGFDTYHHDCVLKILDDLDEEELGELVPYLPEARRLLKDIQLDRHTARDDWREQPIPFH